MKIYKKVTIAPPSAILALAVELHDKCHLARVEVEYVDVEVYQEYEYTSWGARRERALKYVEKGFFAYLYYLFFKDWGIYWKRLRYGDIRVYFQSYYETAFRDKRILRIAVDREDGGRNITDMEDSEISLDEFIKGLSEVLPCTRVEKTIENDKIKIKIYKT